MVFLSRLVGYFLCSIGLVKVWLVRVLMWCMVLVVLLFCLCSMWKFSVME